MGYEKQTQGHRADISFPCRRSPGILEMEPYFTSNFSRGLCRTVTPPRLVAVGATTLHLWGLSPALLLAIYTGFTLCFDRS